MAQKRSSSRRHRTARRHWREASKEVLTEVKGKKRGSRVKSRKQAVRIGLSKARRKGRKVPRKRAHK
jgi:hypothetical protein